MPDRLISFRFFPTFGKIFVTFLTKPYDLKNITLMMYWILFIAISLISYWVQANLKRKFDKYSHIALTNGMTGKEVAEKMLRDNGIYDVRVTSTPGMLTDHYNPSSELIKRTKER